MEPLPPHLALAHFSCYTPPIGAAPDEASSCSLVVGPDILRMRQRQALCCRGEVGLSAVKNSQPDERVAEGWNPTCYWS
jgi:hypothetical protein